MQLGISSYTYGWAIGLPGQEPPHPMREQELLDQALRKGVRLLQVCDNLPLHQLPSERLARFADRARAEGVRLEVGSRGLTASHLQEMIALARQVDARLIRFVMDGPDHHPTPAEVSKLLQEMEPALEGLQLGIENHDRFPARILRSILESVASDRIGICLDTANSLGAGEDLHTVLNALGPLTINLHIKDFQIERVPHLMGFTVTGRPAGQGMLDLPWLLTQLSQSGRCQTAVLELWTPPELSLTSTLAKEELWAVQSLEFLRPFFPPNA